MFEIILKTSLTYLARQYIMKYEKTAQREVSIWKTQGMESSDSRDEQVAKKTKEGTAEAFFFHAMVDRLLEEYRDLEGDRTG